MDEVPRWFLQAVETKPQSHHIDVRGCAIHYLEWGKRGNPGLIFVHGGAAHAHWWSHIAPLFAQKYHVIAIDLSGHGASGWRSEGYPHDVWAQEVIAAGAAAGFPGPPIVIGHSMGGFVTIATAVLRSDKLAGAVIIDSPVRNPDAEVVEGANGNSFRNPKMYPDVETAVARFRTVPDQPSSLPFLLEHVGRHSLRKTDVGVTWCFDPKLSRTEIPTNIHAMLARVRCRIALFRAEHGLVTPDIGEFMYETLGRNAPVIEIPEAYHHVMLDQPLLLVTGLRTLLADWEHSVSRNHRA